MANIINRGKDEVFPNDFRFIWIPKEMSNKVSATFNDIKKEENRFRKSREIELLLSLGSAGIHSWSPTMKNLDYRGY